MLARLVSLSGTERRVLRQATIRVAVVRLWLSLYPIERVMSGVRLRSVKELRPAPTVTTLVWAVQAASRRLLKKNPCLTEALALWWLLRQYGYEGQIRIGVARDGGSHFEAHAWVERDGQVLIGGAQAPTEYVPLPSFDVP